MKDVVNRSTSKMLIHSILTGEASDWVLQAPPHKRDALLREYFQNLTRFNVQMDGGMYCLFQRVGAMQINKKVVLKEDIGDVFAEAHVDEYGFCRTKPATIRKILEKRVLPHINYHADQWFEGRVGCRKKNGRLNASTDVVANRLIVCRVEETDSTTVPQPIQAASIKIEQESPDHKPVASVAQNKTVATKSVAKECIVEKTIVKKESIVEKNGVKKESVREKKAVTKETVMEKTAVTKQTVMEKTAVTNESVMEKNGVAKEDKIAEAYLTPKVPKGALRHFKIFVDSPATRALENAAAARRRTTEKKSTGVVRPRTKVEIDSTFIPSSTSPIWDSSPPVTRSQTIRQRPRAFREFVPVDLKPPGCLERFWMGVMRGLPVTAEGFRFHLHLHCQKTRFAFGYPQKFDDLTAYAHVIGNCVLGYEEGPRQVMLPPHFTDEMVRQVTEMVAVLNEEGDGVMPTISRAPSGHEQGMIIGHLQSSLRRSLIYNSPNPAAGVVPNNWNVMMPHLLRLMNKDNDAQSEDIPYAKQYKIDEEVLRKMNGDDDEQ